MRMGTYNLLNYGTDDARAERVRAVIEAMDVDVLAVQEISATTALLAAHRLSTLAADVGMTSYYRDEGDLGAVAVAMGNHGLAVGLMWRPGRVEPLADTVRAYEERELWHSLIKGVFAVSGTDGARYEVQHASCHLGPFGNFGRNAQEAQRVVSAMTRPANRPPGVIGGDWNCVGADRLSGGEYFDTDPYQSGEWHDGLVYQTRWHYDAEGNRRWEADRTPGDVLWAGGLLDAAAELHRRVGAPWQATAGHWRHGNAPDVFGPRRIDAIRVTREVAHALHSCEVIDSDLARTASDHLPVVVEYDPAEICQGVRDGPAPSGGWPGHMTAGFG